LSIQCQILTEEDKRKVHAESIQILQEVGVKFLSHKALGILKDNGARVDIDTRIARIPEEMVQQALKTAPESFVLGSLSSKISCAKPTKNLNKKELNHAR